MNNSQDEEGAFVLFVDDDVMKQWASYPSVKKIGGPSRLEPDAQEHLEPLLLHRLTFQQRLAYLHRWVSDDMQNLIDRGLQVVEVGRDAHYSTCFVLMMNTTPYRKVVALPAKGLVLVQLFKLNLVLLSYMII